MSDSSVSDSPSSESPEVAATAGSLLRQARMAKGLHIAALATSIKVAPRKLELLEADRFDELPGATFTRALAQTVCRTLKIDAAPVLALLPQPADHNLSQMSLGLNAPFRDKPGRRVPSDLQFLKNPVVLGAALLVVASILLYVLPAGWINDVTQRASAPAEPVVASTVPAPAPANDAASEPLQTSSIVVETVHPASAPAAASAPAVQAAPASSPIVAAAPVASPASTPASGVLLVRASAESWVEVIDGRGTALISRVLQPGEAVGLDGASPLRVKIGNASATQVSFRGKAVDLAPTRDNVAKLELK
ncbi:MAG TPA: RodZ domain-containing protein [Rhizobacter sp.]|nr:RodZ domain-containing protein [Rhizobacter sp.]